VAAGPLRVRRRDPEDGGRQVPQDGFARPVRRAARPGGRGGVGLMGELISTAQDGFVAVVTLDNPPMNALSAALLDELEAEIDRLDADDGTRAIVLRGGGERAF